MPVCIEVMSFVGCVQTWFLMCAATKSDWLGQDVFDYVMNHAESEEFYLLGLDRAHFAGYQKGGKSILAIARAVRVVSTAV